MKQRILLSLLLAIALSACNPTQKGEDILSKKEQMLQQAVEPYVNHTVLPTYRAMADAAIELADLCQQMKDKYGAGQLQLSDVESAGQAWVNSRKHWELSEAFLFGPAANYNIDPSIDSWPLDKTALDNTLARIRRGEDWNIDLLGYGLLGFHTVEYLLFELSEDGTQSHPHRLDYAPEELDYLVAVSEHLRNQCVLLEACWAGMAGVNEAKQQLLEEAELDYNENYGVMMMNAGKAGSIYKTYQEVAEEIIQGCIDIADEVGNTKIGRPVNASSLEDRNYIESPYSLNSIVDFEDNIHSIERSYFGSRNSDASISDYIKTVNAKLDTRLRQAIDASIQAIQAIPEPFAQSASSEVAARAVTVVGNDLVGVLEEVMNQLSN